MTLPQVQAELSTIAARLQREHPKEEKKLGFKLSRPGLVGDYIGGPARAFLAGVMGLAGIVLLAACANLGSPFAARTADRRLLEKVSQLPGVKAAGYANTTPLGTDTSMTDIFAQKTSDLRPSNRAFTSYFYHVSPGYFNAAGTAMLAGRDVSFSDKAKTPAVAVVNQQFARRMFHSEQAIGRYFKNSSGAPIQIVGIVADGKYFTLSEDRQEELLSSPGGDGLPHHRWRFWAAAFYRGYVWFSFLYG